VFAVAASRRGAVVGTGLAGRRESGKFIGVALPVEQWTISTAADKLRRDQDAVCDLAR
jgi:hypothetical protein